MKTPKEKRMELTDSSKWQAAFIGVCIILVIVVLGFIFLPESKSDRITRECTAFMSTVQPGDTLYWLVDGQVEPLSIIRNLVSDRVVVTEGVMIQWVPLDNGWTRRVILEGRREYSYGQVYPNLINVLEKP